MASYISTYVLLVAKVNSMFITYVYSYHGSLYTCNYLSRTYSSFFDQEFLDYKSFALCCSLINGSCKHVIESYTLMCYV